MNLFINGLTDEEVITSYNFARNSDFIFSEILTIEKFSKLNQNNLVKVVESSNQVLYFNKNINISENDIIFCNTYFVKDLFKILKKVKNLKNIKLITNQTDQDITKNLFKHKPDCISKWYSINVNHKSDDLIPIPLGLSNDHPKNLNKEHFSERIGQQEKQDKIYLNFEENTNYIERNKIIKQYKNKEYVFYDKPNLDLETYIKNLKKFKFIFCPPGNGIDTHRTWEAIYAGSIPIVKNDLTMSTLDNLNSILVEKFSSINRKMLKNYEDKKQNNEKLNINYWINLIRENKISSQQDFSFEINEENINEITNNYFKKIKKESYFKSFKTFQRKLLRKISFV